MKKNSPLRSLSSSGRSQFRVNRTRWQRENVERFIMIEVSGQTFYLLENSSGAVYFGCFDEPKNSFTRVSRFLYISVVHDYDLLLQLFHVLWSTWTRFIWYRSSSAQTSLNNYRILSKPRYYVNSDILVKLYYALIYPFLTYGLISWGNTYSSTTQPLFILQKRAMRMMTFSELNFVSILV